MSDQFFYLFSAGLLGLAIGALLMYFFSSKGGNSAKSVAKVEQKLNKYQEDVVQHFEQTADLVDELTNSYKKVFDHLGKSAKELLTEEQVQQQIEKRAGKKVTLGYLVDETTENEVQTELETSDSEDISIDEDTQSESKTVSAEDNKSIAESEDDSTEDTSTGTDNSEKTENKEEKD